jgi:hypothetical protein
MTATHADLAATHLHGQEQRLIIPDAIARLRSRLVPCSPPRGSVLSPKQLLANPGRSNGR